MVTTNELRELLNKNISQSVKGGFKIHVAPQYYTKAKYSCTEDEKEFQFIKGHVYFKGYELISA